jgi:predicted Holliday junction resolvase-like endonuclease
MQTVSYRIKSGKNHLLTEEEKAYNERLSQRRVVIEHINGKMNNRRASPAVSTKLLVV